MNLYFPSLSNFDDFSKMRKSMQISHANFKFGTGYLSTRIPLAPNNLRPQKPPGHCFQVNSNYISGLFLKSMSQPGCPHLQVHRGLLTTSIRNQRTRKTPQNTEKISQLLNFDKMRISMRNSL